jgi:hypothetical protein
MYGYPARELGLDTEYRSLSFLKKQQKVHFIFRISQSRVSRANLTVKILPRGVLLKCRNFCAPWYESIVNWVITVSNSKPFKTQLSYRDRM